MNETKPQNHDKNVSGQGKPVVRRGDALGTGPVGEVQKGRPVPQKPDPNKK